MAVLAPMPSAKVTSTTAVKAGLLAFIRKPKRTSWSSSLIVYLASFTLTHSKLQVGDYLTTARMRHPWVSAAFDHLFAKPFRGSIATLLSGVVKFGSKGRAICQEKLFPNNGVS